MSNDHRILMVDDEENVLSGYRRTIGRSYDFTTANGGQAPLEMLRKGERFAVIITDMRMPQMDGVQFLCEARKICPDTVFAMLTGNADQQTAIDAITDGQIYRFLNKPCEKEVLEKALKACLRQYDLIHSEKMLLKNTLSGSVKLLAELTTVSDPVLGRMSSVLRRDVQCMCRALDLKQDWRIKIAAALCLIGLAVTPDAEGRTTLDEGCLRASAATGANCLKKIPRLEPVATMIGQMREAGPLPDSFADWDEEEAIVTGSQILRFLLGLQRETLRHNGDRSAALLALCEEGGDYDERIVDAAKKVRLDEQTTHNPNAEFERVSLPPKKLQIGMIVDMDVVTSDGRMLLSKGHALSELLIDRLVSYARIGRFEGEIWVIAEKKPGESEESLAA